MGRIAYIILYTFSLLPLGILNAFFSMGVWMLRVPFGYRKAVIQDNLTKCFPEKSEPELKAIELGFYRFLGRMAAEFVKNISISSEKAKDFIEVKNPEVLEEAFRKNDIVFLMVGHYGNWEILGSVISLHIEAQFHALYKPLRSKSSQWFIDQERLRHGTKVIPFKTAYRDLQKLKGKHLIEFISDQSPLRNNAVWKTFFGRETPVFKGTEKIAARIGAPVLYGRVEVGPLGKYSLEYVPVLEEANTTDWPLTGKTVELLEENIRRAPQYWLWSHRRWKYGPNA